LVLFDSVLLQNTSIAFLLVLLFSGLAVIALSQTVSLFFANAETAAPAVAFSTVVAVFVPYFLITFALENVISDFAVLLFSSFLPTFNILMCFRELGDSSANDRLYTTGDLFSTDRLLLPLLLLLLVNAVCWHYLAVYLDEHPLASICKSCKHELTRRRVSISHRLPTLADHSKQTASISRAPSAASVLVLDELCKEFPAQRPVEDGKAADDAKDTVSSKRVTADGRFIAVNQLNLDVRRAECLGFLGPNGAGKTTTISMLCGLTSISSGTASISGLDITQANMAQIRRSLGVCTQFDAL
jgi:ABC-type multidrug transport system fused ATPase/permease subunit